MTTTHLPAPPAGFTVTDLPQGRLAYRVAGPASSSRPPVVFVHGVLVDARLWERVADRLASAGILSYAPTLPLGAHQWPMNASADLSPQGIATLVLDFISALGLSDVTVVGNDTGGAICQVLLGTGTGLVSAAVLTNCDALGTFPPRALAPLFSALRHPRLVAGLAQALRSQTVRHGPLAFGPLSSEPLDPDLTLSWIQPLADRAIRRDIAKFARGVHPRVLLDAATRFGDFTGPVRILWGEDDPFFRTRLGQQLSEAFPHATFTTVPAGRTFLPLDHPEDVAGEIAAAGGPSVASA
ncbi:MAG TPA: alpha/beta hydrolase [Streptosporangiaceae bacterium]|nr:alpha/beta hydrolase [Streptosporangiaceae bacterium]